LVSCSVLRLFELGRLPETSAQFSCFVRNETTQEWFIKNVGTGRALDVVVAEKDPDDGKPSLKDANRWPQ
jgi:hypothetical protein